MSKHRYRLTIETLDSTTGNTLSDQTPLVFESDSHDDWFDIVQRARQRGDLDGESATAFAIGLKLFSQVMLKHRDLPLFEPFLPHFRTFMQTLKRPG